MSTAPTLTAHIAVVVPSAILATATPSAIPIPNRPTPTPSTAALPPESRPHSNSTDTIHFPAHTTVPTRAPFMGLPLVTAPPKAEPHASAITPFAFLPPSPLLTHPALPPPIRRSPGASPPPATPVYATHPHASSTAPQSAVPAAGEQLPGSANDRRGGCSGSANERRGGTPGSANERLEAVWAGPMSGWRLVGLDQWGWRL
ncbi:hypothetical protein CYMTET_10496 [Cymbomonas tetramitiformis]|uniref:Uncharacterized protein n=1 Tax=Cymbomonas tetramitiformis TaxID=36881 RepID=A0AAE0GPF4_9CHLO|nr:hypothetical protein CYMTET_10496 [Cymbomonas tetramitiformis]